MPSVCAKCECQSDWKSREPLDIGLPFRFNGPDLTQLTSSKGPSAHRVMQANDETGKPRNGRQPGASPSPSPRYWYIQLPSSGAGCKPNQCSVFYYAGSGCAERVGPLQKHALYQQQEESIYVCMARQDAQITADKHA